ncbi:MAG TPA: BON domain-containing protein, partial [Gammaproteobacteria bacterium]|nr:BON domain-containing protein [Gammaproteobacteria bacterium]
EGYVFSESLTLHGPYAGRGPKGYKRSDQQIVEDACQRLERDGEVDASDIEVTAELGVIRLRGTVPDRRTKRRAEECVESVYGAHDVMNELRVSYEGREQWQGGQSSQSQGAQAGRGTQASQASQGTQSSQGTQTSGQRPGAGTATSDQLGEDKRSPRH